MSENNELTLDEKRREAARLLREAGERLGPIREDYSSRARRVYFALCDIVCAEPVKAGYGLFESLANLIDPDATDEMVTEANEHARKRNTYWETKRRQTDN